MSKTDEYERVCATIKRLRSRLKRTMTSLDKAEKKKMRLDRKMLQPPEAPTHKTHTTRAIEAIKQAAPMGMCNDGEVDPFALGPFMLTEADKKARAEVQAEVDAEKKHKAEKAAEKRAIKKEVIEADLTGKRRKMPLTGKDALAAIHGK